MNTRQEVEGYLLAASLKPRWEDRCDIQGIQLGGNAQSTKWFKAGTGEQEGPLSQEWRVMLLKWSWSHLPQSHRKLER